MKKVWFGTICVIIGFEKMSIFEYLIYDLAYGYLIRFGMKFWKEFMKFESYICESYTKKKKRKKKKKEKKKDPSKFS